VSKPVGATERIPVLTFLTNFLIGGTERQVVNLVQNYDRARFDVHLACFRRAGPLLQEIDMAGVALADYPITTLPSPRTLWQQARLARYARAQGIRIVHSFGFYANVFAIPAARLARVGVVVASIRDIGDHLTWLQKTLQKWVCRAADHVLVNASAVQEVLLAQGYAPSRISVIRNGIDVSRFRDRAGTEPVRPGLGLPPTAPVVAVFSRLNRLKGIEYFLEAAALLAKSFEEVRFLIVGDSISDAYRVELEQFAAGLGLAERVVFTGFRSDVPELLSEVCVSVLPSLSEGLSNVVLEAMAAGVPIVATSVGGTPEMVEDGVTGLLVPPRDAAALAQAIGSLLGDPARGRSIGQAARRRVAERFSLEATVRETEQLYERLLRAVPERRRKGSAADRGREAAVGLSPRDRPFRDEEWQ
jgi:glycosyltransferase involved in cell wall biosynthesis